MAGVADRSRALDAVLAERHSCRSFRDGALPVELIDEIIASAAQAPSWCNTQPWQVVVLSGSAVESFRHELYAAAETDPHAVSFEAGAPRYVGQSLARRRAAGWALYEAVGAAPGDRAATARQALENFRFFGAPHVAIVSADASLGAYGLVDCGGFVSLLLAAAQARGVGSIAQAAVVSRPEMVRRHTGIPADRTLVCGIALGWPDRDHPANSFRTDRASLDELRVHRGSPPEETR
ncbi:hypothetical protein AD006_32085 (plasmid) [Pseudonocardia sp. EC080610-09]|nr:hypothetical protein AD006_32085 [Pseudonocardia sp. EC080610-09]ALL85701.1 hypothetical protein AD017_28615 [Pseudonocardia sp. EC080619-01]